MVQGEWSFFIKASTVNAVSGDVHRGPNLDGSVFLALAPSRLPVDVAAKSFGDVYGSFMQLDEGVLRVGTVGAELPLNGRFSDYDDLGIYGGVRYHFSSESSWKPFVSAQIGLKDIDDFTALFSFPGVTFVDPYQGAMDENDSVLDVLGPGILDDEGDLANMPFTLGCNFNS